MEEIDEFEEDSFYVNEISFPDNRCSYTGWTMKRHTRVRCGYYRG